MERSENVIEIGEQISGHKKKYCFDYLVTTAPDGIIVDVSGAFAGRKNDHIKQNESRISERLVACQDGHNAVSYNTCTDKGNLLNIYLKVSLVTNLFLNLGFHIQPCIKPMYNNLINTEVLPQLVVNSEFTENSSQTLIDCLVKKILPMADQSFWKG